MVAVVCGGGVWCWCVLVVCAGGVCGGVCWWCVLVVCADGASSLT